MAKQQPKQSFQPEFPGQHPTEKVELVFRQHPIVMRKQLIYGLLIVAVSEIPLLLLPEQFYLALKILLGGVIAALIYGFFHWMGWYYSVYILTDSRLVDVKQKGFFNRKVSEVGLDKVQSINYHIKGFQASMFKFGDITAQTYVGDWVMKSISHPVEVHSKMMDVAHDVLGSTPPVN